MHVCCTHVSLMLSTARLSRCKKWTHLNTYLKNEQLLLSNCGTDCVRKFSVSSETVLNDINSNNNTKFSFAIVGFVQDLRLML